MAGKRQLPPVWDDSDDGAAVSGGSTGADSRLDRLVAMRDVMTRHVDNPNTLARDLAALVRQIREVDREIEELEQEAEVREAAVSEVGSGDAPFRLEVV